MNENGGEIRYDRNFNEGMSNRKYFAKVDDGMQDCFKIDCGMRDEKQKITLRGEPRL